ncbi:MAG: hypothetical protein ACLUNQ_08215 [Oscillospiraceae bacterium]
MTDGARLIDLLRRPQMTYDELMTFDPSRAGACPKLCGSRWRSP